MPITPTITQGTPSATGELAPLESSGFDSTTLKYPDNVGSNDVPHFMVFNIYVPSGDNYAIKTFGADPSATSASQQNMDFLNSSQNAQGGQKLTNASASKTGIAAVAAIAGLQTFLETDGSLRESALDGLTTGVKEGAIGGVISSFVANQISFRPKLTRINRTVALYLPDTVMSEMNHNYDAISATDAMGELGLASALGESVLKGFNWKDPINSIKSIYKQRPAGAVEIAGSLSEASGLVGPGFTDLALKSSGLAVNPQLELIYRGTSNRSFILEFKFQPRSAKERDTITSIINTFKMFSSPSIQPSARGRYFIVPAQFDIQFKFGNAVNQYISKITTSVCEGVAVNYAGAGQFASMTDGMPADIYVQLRFREAEILTRELVQQFGY